MRSLPAGYLAKLKNPIQTPATDADPRLEAWISRNTTPLTRRTARFLERFTVLSGTNITAADIAVKRPRRGGTDREIYIAYIKDGTARVRSSPFTARMENHVFVDSGFAEAADDVAIAFDGRMPHGKTGAEFVTDGEPWVFWCKDGVLKAQILHANMPPVVLATANCTKVTAIRAPSADTSATDYGLCVFFLLAGAVYGRQLIGGEWTDATQITAVSGSFVDLAATRTWDYRVALQLRRSNGSIVELYTKYLGLPDQMAEHIDIERIDANGNLITIRYRETAEAEHIELTRVSASGGLYRTGQPEIVSVLNTGGRQLTVVFDRHIDPASLAANARNFSVTDEDGNVFHALSVVFDGLTAIFSTQNFNAAVGECTLAYAGGDLVTMAGETVEPMGAEFTPTGLVPPVGGLPHPVAVTSDAEGLSFAVQFSEELTEFSAADYAHFAVVCQEYTYVPGGTLETVEHTPSGMTLDGDTVTLRFALGVNKGVSYTLAYDGAALIGGEGGPVQAFSFDFTPSIPWKGNQNDAEHIEIASITASGTLTAIEYSDYKAADEHIEIASITASGVLTHVDDI